MNGNVVSVIEGHYLRLLEDSQLLAALRAEGVDNWEGYSRAVKAIQEENEATDIGDDVAAARQDAAVDNQAPAA